MVEVYTLLLRTANRQDMVNNVSVIITVIFFLLVGCAKNIGIMFLNEVALGSEHSITRDDSSLKAAPKGFDSVVARGHTEPGQLSLKS